MSNRPVIRAVVFDMDGLMLNTEDIFELAGVELMARRGLK
jgi:beta-phosphoglucomutase-like phosphatase (HAD superfamily)